MSDPRIDEFNTRISRIQKARSRGYGFEAVGTLGRSYYTRKNNKFRLPFPVLRPAVALFVCVTVVKAVLLHQLGSQAYDERVQQLMAGSEIDRMGGWLMQADPITTNLSHKLGAVLRTLS